MGLGPEGCPNCSETGPAYDPEELVDSSEDLRRMREE